MKRLTTITILVSLAYVEVGMAANVTNNITGVGPKDNLVSPYFCIQDVNGQVTYALAPGKTVNANQYSGNPYYVGGALRFGGCTTNDSYLGYLGLTVNELHQNKVSTYSPPQGVHVVFADPNIDGNGSLTGKIQYTPIAANENLLNEAPRQNAIWDFVGFNLSGLEFSKMIDPVVIPNLSVEDASGSFSDLAETKALLSSGMNTVRVPLSWGYLQLEGPGKGEINLNYYDAYVKPLLQTLTKAKVMTIVDLHAYMRYSIFGKEYSGCGADGKCPDGTLVLDTKAYQDIWGKLYTLIKNDPKIDMNYIMLDLVNEPVDVPNDLVFTIQAEIIKHLRQLGFKGYILVEGNVWSGLHSWTTAKWQSTDGKTTYTNATLFTRENFVKAGITDLSRIVINVHQYFDSNFSGTQNMCVTDLSTQGEGGYNLNKFRDYLQQERLKAMVTEMGTGKDQASCSVALTKFLNYMQDNSAKNKEYGFMGWTMWSTGHGWGDYHLRLTPTSYHMQVLRNYLSQ